MSDHPYRRQPASAFWSSGVANGFKPGDLAGTGAPLIRRGDKVASAGSCFAANIIAPIEKAGFTYLRTRTRHPAFAAVDGERFGYDVFSAGYGNVYTPRQLLQLLRRATGGWAPIEDRWHIDDHVVDPFRPGLRYPALSDAEFDALTAQHLRETREMFEQADVFVFTLGLTEAWVSLADGAVFPASPGTVAGMFDPVLHGFVNFGFAEVAADLDAFIAEVAALNPAMRIILTVSPVPLVATAGTDHVAVATAYSKAVLRAAGGEAAARHPHVHYFPAYEIVTGPHAGSDRFEADRRNPSKAAIADVMRALLMRCEAGAAPAAAPLPAQPSIAALSQAIADAECEEAMSDRRG